VALVAVVLVVESYQALIQQAVQQVHLDKVTLVVLVLEVVLAVNQAVAVAVLAPLVLLVLNFTVAQAVMVLHHLLQEQALLAVAVAVVESFQLAM
jgi:hypothetical protein